MKSELEDFLQRIVNLLKDAKIEFMITGSFASTAHGQLRTTQDIDIVVAPSPASLDAFLESLPVDAYYVDAETAADARRTRTMFNVVDMISGGRSTSSCARIARSVARSSNAAFRSRCSA